MRDGWTGMELGELFDLVAQRHDPGDLEAELPYLGLENLETGLPTPAGFGRAGDVSSSVTPFEPDDVLFGRLRPYLRKVVHVDRPGVCTPEILVLRARDQVVLPRYLHLLVSSETVIERCVQMSAGSRMPRTSAADLAGIEVDVPPLVVQRRVVDLVDAVDTYAAAGRWLGEVAGRCLVAAISDHEADVPAGDHSRPLSDYVAHTIGGVWGVEPGGDEVDVAVVRSTEFRNDGALGGSGVRRSITMRQLDSRRLQDGDILLEKSGGGPKQPVGRVVSVQDIGSDPTVCANFVQLVRPDPDAVNPRYLFHRMWGWHRAGRTLEYQAQTTGIRNLRTKDYLAQPISLPERAEQDRLADLWDALVDMTTAAVTNAEDAGVLRASLLDELLSGEREIPGSYDELVRLVA